MPQHDDALFYAGFWGRLGAWVIDTVITSLVTIPILMSMYGVDYWKSGTTHGPAQLCIAYGLPAAMVIGFWVGLSTTPGKMMIGAVIVDARSGGKPHAGQFFMRYIGYVVSAALMGLGYLWIAFDPRKQALHDKMSGTVVVRRKAQLVAPVQFDTDPGTVKISA